MTHTANILIPAQLVFRPFRVRWEITWATIVGWAIRPVSPLMILPPGAKYEVAPTGDSVRIRLALRKEEGESGNARGFLTSLYGTSDYESLEVEMKRNDLPPDCLQPHENPDTAPDIEGREFMMFACRLSDVNGRGVSWQPHEPVRDAWAMREHFFALENTYDALQFLNRWGLWDFAPIYERESLRMRPFSILSPHRLWTLRDSYIKAAAGSPRAWLTTATPLSLKETDKRPYFVVERSYCEEAIKATLTIDHLGKVKFGICKRHDCRKLFKRKTAQKRLYCTPECAHLANVRKLRAEKRKAQPTPKARKTDAKG